MLTFNQQDKLQEEKLSPSRFKQDFYEGETNGVAYFFFQNIYKQINSGSVREESEGVKEIQDELLHSLLVRLH